MSCTIIANEILIGLKRQDQSRGILNLRRKNKSIEFFLIDKLDIMYFNNKSLPIQLGINSQFWKDKYMSSWSIGPLPVTHFVLDQEQLTRGWSRVYINKENISINMRSFKNTLKAKPWGLNPKQTIYIIELLSTVISILIL